MDCFFTIDGENPTQLAKDKIIRLEVSSGDHILEAVSKDFSDAKWRAIVSGVAGQQKAVLITLKAAVTEFMDTTDCPEEVASLSNNKLALQTFVWRLLLSEIASDRVVR